MTREKYTTDMHVYSSRVFWSAILAGALIIIGLTFLLNLFGVAIGLSAFATNSDDGSATLAIGGLIGIVIGIIVATLAAGYAAGYLGRPYSPRRNLGIVYGFTTWSLALILTAFIAGPIAKYVSEYSVMVTNSAANNAQDKSEGKNGGEMTEAVKKSIELKGSMLSKGIAWGAATVFVLFFIGAISCCVGAYWGMSSDRDD